MFDDLLACYPTELGPPQRAALYHLCGAMTVSLGLACAADTHEDPTASAAVIEPDCTRTGDLTVELGEGADDFELIPADGQPILHHGAQGGTHLVLAARLLTPDPLDRYELRLIAEAGQEPCADEDCAGFVTIGQFEGIIEGSAQIEQIDADEVEITSLFLLVDNWHAAPVQRLTLEIGDACARNTSTVRSFVTSPHS